MRLTRAFFLSAIIAACHATTTFAQMPAYTTAGPIPPALANAKSVFVSNGGSEGIFPGRYSGDADRPYTEFYGALKATGDFTLVADPARADLVIQINLVEHGQDGGTYHWPMFQLVIYDAKSRYILWTITRSIDGAARKSTNEKNFDDALSAVLDQFLEITGKTPAPAH